MLKQTSKQVARLAEIFLHHVEGKNNDYLIIFTIRQVFLRSKIEKYNLYFLLNYVEGVYKWDTFSIRTKLTTTF